MPGQRDPRHTIRMHYGSHTLPAGPLQGWHRGDLRFGHDHSRHRGWSGCGRRVWRPRCGSGIAGPRGSHRHYHGGLVVRQPGVGGQRRDGGAVPEIARSSLGQFGVYLDRHGLPAGDGTQVARYAASRAVTQGWRHLGGQSVEEGHGGSGVRSRVGHAYRIPHRPARKDLFAVQVLKESQVCLLGRLHPYGRHCLVVGYVRVGGQRRDRGLVPEAAPSVRCYIDIQSERGALPAADRAQVALDPTPLAAALGWGRAFGQGVQQRHSGRGVWPQIGDAYRIGHFAAGPYAARGGLFDEHQVSGGILRLHAEALGR